MLKVFQLLEDSRPLLSVLITGISAVLCVFSVMNYLGQPPNLLLGIIFFFIVFSIYLSNHFTDIKEDFVNNTKSFMFIDKMPVLLVVGIICAASAILILVFLEKLKAFHVVLLALGFLYSFRLIPWFSKEKGLYYLRIKEIPFAKSFIVSGLWGSSVFLMPKLFLNFSNPPLPVLICLVGTLIISLFCNTVFCDIRDIEGDRMINTPTIPVTFGVKTSMWIIISTGLFWLISMLVLFLIGGINRYLFIFVFINMIFPYVYLTLYHNGLFNRFELTWIADSEILVYSAMLLLIAQ